MRLSISPFFAFSLCLGIILCSCYLPRSRSPIAEVSWPEKKTAILPVRHVDFFDYSSENEENIYQDKIEKLGNSILNTLTKSKKDQIFGPDELPKEFVNESILEIISICFLTPMKTTCQIEKITVLAQNAGIENIVQIKIDVRQRESEFLDNDSWGTVTKGSVSVWAEMASLSPMQPFVNNRAIGSADYEKKKGWTVGSGGFFVSVVPFAYGTTMGRAVEQATRAALTDLFVNSGIPDLGNPESECPTGVVLDKKNRLEWLLKSDNDMTWHESHEWIMNMAHDEIEWRMPTRKELRKLYKSAHQNILAKFLISKRRWVWAAEKKGQTSAHIFRFNGGLYGDSRMTTSYNHRALAVREMK